MAASAGKRHADATRQSCTDRAWHTEKGGNVNTTLKRRLRTLGMAVISFGLLGLFWQLSAGTIFNTILVPSPGETFRTAWQMLQTGELGRHVGVSLMRVLIGYVCGCLQIGRASCRESVCQYV